VVTCYAVVTTLMWGDARFREQAVAGAAICGPRRLREDPERY
jgi:hypothetical protein